MVVRVSTGLKPIGDWVNGSGEVPQEELGPPWEFDEAEGDDVVVAAPLLLDSALPRPAEATLLLVKGGLKMPEKLARSSLAWLSRPFVDLEPIEP
jgi:hypothetical protein